MAEQQDENDKTEDPTQRRLEQALERGDVAKSQEVNTWFIIAASTLIIMGFSSCMWLDLAATMCRVIANSYRFPTDGASLPRFFEKISVEVLAALAIPLL